MADWRNPPMTIAEKLVDEWLTRIEHARKSKEAFNAVGDACYSFYARSAKFMWEDKFRKKYIGNINTPKFEVTINAAFEFVAIFGPYLMWDYPHRSVRPYEPLQLDPELFAGPEGPSPFFQNIVAQQEQQTRIARMRCALMEHYLNYSQREQPAGLWHHSQLAVLDALVRGRGVLKPSTYRNPGSSRTLTQLEYVPVSQVFIDPDCCDPLFETATWMCVQHKNWPTYKVEDRFNLPRGTLDEAGNLESVESMATNNRAIDQMHRSHGRTNDLITWYEIWTKCGVAGRSSLRDSDLAEMVDENVGDFAYLCIAHSVPWPLNAPPASFHDEITPEEISEMLGWPTPLCNDGKWPLAFLDFYPDSEGPWPIAPLSAGLGHLICLNVLMSAYVEQAFENRKSIIAALEGAKKEAQEALNSKDNPAFVTLKGEIEQDISRCIQYLNRPNMNTDILQAIEMELMLFQRATSLVDFMYGSEQKVSRSARDIAAKEEKTAIRPEKMARDVAAWQTLGATMEAFTAALNVQGADVDPYIPAPLWDMLISTQDPELVMREMDCIVEATDVRRPNRERDLSNLQTLAQQATAAFMQYAQISGDSEPLNNYFSKLFKAMEQPYTGMEMGPWVPQPPPPEVAEQMQAQMQAEQMKSQAEIEGKQLDIQAKMVDAQSKSELAQLKMAVDVQKMQIEALRAQMDMEQSQMEHSQEMQQDAQKHQLELFQSREQFALESSQREAEGQQKMRLMKRQPQGNGQAQ